MSLKKNPWKFTAVGINYEGKQITLPSDPKNMEIPHAIEELQRIEDQNEQYVNIFEPVDCFPLEGAHAMMCVLKEMFGWARSVPTPGFFGPNPPTMVNMPIGVNKSTKVTWGRFELPMLEGYLETSKTRHESEDRMIFCLKGEVKQKFKEGITEIAKGIRDYVANHSIYQGKAIQLALEGEAVDWNKPPVFLDTKSAKLDELVFNADVMAEVQASLFNPIQHTERCRKFGVPLRRGVLLAGPYGTGKTLTAQIVSQMCEGNGWTYIYLKDVRALDGALTFARRYQPAVVFAEDVDRAISGERTSEIDKVLNTIDGVDAKHGEIITILTTNKVEEINQAMLRPGRLDSVINIDAPDAEAVQRLLRIYGRGMIAKDEELKTVGGILAGNIPAVIREVVERSKLHAVSRNGDELILKEADLCGAAKGMVHHLELLKPKKVELSNHEKLGSALAAVTEDAVGKHGDGIVNRVNAFTQRALNE